MTRPVFRFAPSPNGYLHLGHAFSALLNHDLAKTGDGRFLLRVEDIDPERCRPEFEQATYEDLAWLGLHWEKPVHRQSEHMACYEAALDMLKKSALLYPCFCTRGAVRQAVAGREGWPCDPDGAVLYPRICRSLGFDEITRRLNDGEPHVWRIDCLLASKEAGALSWLEFTGDHLSRIEATPCEWGDAVIARRDVPTSYHLSVVIDDAAQGVTHVVRGRDLFQSTSLHRLLQSLLGLPTPLYHHHGLILDEHGNKLSKSIASQSLRELRKAGVTPEEIRRCVGLA